MTAGAQQQSRSFDDNTLLPILFGAHNANLARIEEQLNVAIETQGNQVHVRGQPASLQVALSCIDALYDRARRGGGVGFAEVDAAVRMSRSLALQAGGNVGAVDDATIRTRKYHITPRSPRQVEYVRAMDAFDLVFGLGPAGTGKTYLAVAKAVSLMAEGLMERIVLSRPAVEAGERLGFLPGDLKEKIDPYLRPLYDALYDMMPADQIAKRLASGEIEVAPLAFMRGRTLSNAVVILDEAQNTTPAQMKMFLTRLGDHSKMIVNGDLTQVDLPPGETSGLADAVSLLQGDPQIGVVRFGAEDVVRHELVSRIVTAYEKRNAERRAGGAV